MIFNSANLPKGPLLIFDAEEINTIRAMLLRSDWRCEVTDQMRGFLESSEVTEHLENKRREAALAVAKRAGAFYPEQVVKVMFRVQPEVTLGNMEAWCEAYKRTNPCLHGNNCTDGLFPRERDDK